MTGFENDGACVYPSNNGFRLPSNHSGAMFYPYGYSFNGNGSTGFNNNFRLCHVLAHQTSPLTNPQQVPIAYGSTARNPSGCRLRPSLDQYHWTKKIIFGLALTQKGSDLITSALSLKRTTLTDLIFRRLIDFVYELMVDQHGHQVFVELIKSGSHDQLSIIIDRITFDHSIISASKTRTGSSSVKKLIDVLKKSPLIIKTITALHGGFYELMISQTGANVISKCLDLIDTRTNEILYAAAILHSHRTRLLQLIATNSLYLSQDPSGNYLLQKVVEFDNSDIIDVICSKLKGNIVNISLNKVGSYVVEKILKSRGMHHVVQELLYSNQLLQVAKDQYGNYVVQTALEASKRDGITYYQQLMVKLKEHLDALQHGYGRNVHRLIKADVPID